MSAQQSGPNVRSKAAPVELGRWLRSRYCIASSQTTRANSNPASAANIRANRLATPAMLC